jgi:hypothetical protein
MFVLLVVLKAKLYAPLPVMYEVTSTVVQLLVVMEPEEPS